MEKNIDESKAKELLDKIYYSGSKPMARYTLLDLVQFHEFVTNNPSLNIRECLKAYKPLLERKTAKERLKNLLDGLGIDNELYPPQE